MLVQWWNSRCLTRIKKTDTINLVEGSRLILDSVSRKNQDFAKRIHKSSKVKSKETSIKSFWFLKWSPDKISWLNPQVFILESTKRNPDGVMNQDLNLDLNRIKSFILDCIQKRFLESPQDESWINSFRFNSNCIDEVYSKSKANKF